jgi:two-component system, NtrC family, sensor kinase
MKKKILLSFLVGAAIMAALSAFLYANFAEISAETAFLELTDTVRSKSLQLRRHEKNYLLYAPAAGTDEAASIRTYLGELDAIIAQVPEPGRGLATSLGPLVREYRQQFGRIETLVTAIARESAAFRARSTAYGRVSGLVEANFLDKPLADVAYLRSDHALAADSQLILWLQELDTLITGLRKTGEGILTASKELDRSAREKVDDAIRRSQTALFVFYPVFLAAGFGVAALVAGSLVRRLKVLAGLVEETGAGHFTAPPRAAAAGAGGDEVDLLTRKFYVMEEQLEKHERELVQAKKLAAIGTLAAGVAHELNNPLNNISTTAQRLLKKAGEDASPLVRKGLDDIHGQTLRLKSIVGDLLEFARAREPHRAAVELGDLVRSAWRSAAASRDTGSVLLRTELHPPEIVLQADREQLERIFINLFVNAVDAMPGGGTLTVRAEEDGEVTIVVSDTGSGIPPDRLEKVFEPFFTSKDRGTGLGLAIVFGIVQRHRGTIRVGSAVGAGTTFTLTLPLHGAVRREGPGTGGAR